MKIRLQEIEFGVNEPSVSKDFYTLVLGLDAVVDQPNLTVFGSGNAGVDFNVSRHLPAKTLVVSFLTDDLQAIADRLIAQGISFEGPKLSHLKMTTIEFRDPDGYLIKVNQPGEESPAWLVV